MSKIGRNEPCPCGSGKKYKHCCQDKIEAEQRQQNAPASSLSEFSPEALGGIKDDQKSDLQLALSKAALESVKKLQGNEHGELDEITWQLETAVEFEENQSAIIKTLEELEQYKDEYDLWHRNHPEEETQQALRLFSEAPFEKIRFKQEDIERIIKAQGPMPSLCDLQRFRDYTIRALNSLLDEEGLKIIAQFLVLQLPVYYSQKRYMDACLILHNAHVLSIFKQKGNDVIPPFLIFKLKQAMKTKWSEYDQKYMEFLDKIGLGINELRKKIQGKEYQLNLTEDQQAQLTEFFATNPELHEELQAQMADHITVLEKLLKTREGQSLLFKSKEMQPWFARFAKALEGDQRLQKNLNPQTKLSEQENMEIFSEILEKISEEMAKEIFTVKRLALLNQEIQSTQHKLLKQGRKEFNVFLKMWMAYNQTPIAKFSPVNSQFCKLSLTKTIQQAAMAAQKNGE